MNIIGVNEHDVSYVETTAELQDRETESISKTSSEEGESLNQESNLNDKGNKKHKESAAAVWTTDTTLTLLKLYEAKLDMLETPKKKTRIWIAISENLKEKNIEVTPDQVRWKINALAKKYKQCIDSGEHSKFRFFQEMDNIYSQYNVECTDFAVNADRLVRKRARRDQCNHLVSSNKTLQEDKAMIQMRKIRLATRIEDDRSQIKINLEKQWLDYLKRKEKRRRWRDEIFERNLRLKEEELELRRKELEIKESLELRQIQIKERDQEEMLLLEKEKCDLLKRIFYRLN